MLSLDAFSRVQMSLAVGLCPPPLGELERSPRHPSRNQGRGPILLRGGREEEGRERREGKGREGHGEVEKRRDRGEECLAAGLSKLQLTSGLLLEQPHHVSYQVSRLPSFSCISPLHSHTSAAE